MASSDLKDRNDRMRPHEVRLLYRAYRAQKNPSKVECAILMTRVDPDHQKFMKVAYWFSNAQKGDKDSSKTQLKTNMAMYIEPDESAKRAAASPELEPYREKIESLCQDIRAKRHSTCKADLAALMARLREKGLIPDPDPENVPGVQDPTFKTLDARKQAQARSARDHQRRVGESFESPRCIALSEQVERKASVSLGKRKRQEPVIAESKECEGELLRLEPGVSLEDVQLLVDIQRYDKMIQLSSQSSSQSSKPAKILIGRRHVRK